MIQVTRRAEAVRPRVHDDEKQRAVVLAEVDAGSVCRVAGGRQLPENAGALDGHRFEAAWTAAGLGEVEPSTAIDDWRLQAACRGLDTSLFFPGRGESTVEAEAVCAGCPVRADCLWHALGTVEASGGERFGIWGGTSERRRRDLRKAQARRLQR